MFSSDLSRVLFFGLRLRGKGGLKGIDWETLPRGHKKALRGLDEGLWLKSDGVGLL